MITALLLSALPAVPPAAEHASPLSADPTLRLAPARLTASDKRIDDSPFDYDYTQTTFQAFDLRGLRFDASYALGESGFILDAHVENVEIERSRFDRTLRSASVGGGYVYNANDKLDLLATAGLEGARLAPSIIGKSDVGLRFRAGARFAATETIEVFNNVVARTIFGGTDVQVELGGRFELKHGFSAIASFEFGDHTSVGVGIRQSF